MTNDENLYRAPASQLVHEVAPQAFYAKGLSPRYFVIAAWCALLYFAGSIVQLVMGMTQEFLPSASGPDWSALYSTVPLTVTASVAMLTQKTLLTYRFLHARSNWLINCNIVLVCSSIPLAPFLAITDDLTSWPWLSLFGVVFLGGVLSL